MAPYRDPTPPLEPPCAPDVAPIRIPRGTIASEPGAPVRVTLALGPDGERALRELLRACASLSESRFLLPIERGSHEGRIELVYPAEPPGTLPFTAVLPLWRRRLPVHLPLILAFTRFLLAAVDDLKSVGFDPVSFSPLQVRFTPERPGGFRILLLPIVEADLSDWAASSPHAWGWMWRGALLGHRPAHATAYAVGAALHTCVAGEPVPSHLPADERFRRVLSGRIAGPAPSREALARALPPGLEPELDAAVALMCELLAPADAPPPDWRARLGSLLDALSPERLITRWEHAGRLETAHAMMSEVARSLPASEVPWRILTRMRRAMGDVEGAVAAQLDDLFAHPCRETLRETMRLLRGLDAAVPDTRRVLVDALAQLARAELGPPDVLRLWVADLEARSGQRPEEARRLLEGPCADVYCEGMRALLESRLLAEAGDYPRTSLRAKQGIACLEEAMSYHGDAARYGIAYLRYLDGVANYGAIGALRDASFLADAYEAFVGATDGAVALGELAAPLADACVRWLEWIVRFAAAIRAPSFDVVRAGVSAYLAARGVRRDAAPLGPPPLLVYDVELLLPLALSGETPWTS